MNCPACRSPLKEHKSPKGVTFWTCSRWPECRVYGTPELVEQAEAKRLLGDHEEPEPVQFGTLVVGVAQLRIHQAKLKRCKTAEEKEAIRKQFLELLK